MDETQAAVLAARLNEWAGKLHDLETAILRDLGKPAFGNVFLTLLQGHEDLARIATKVAALEASSTHSIKADVEAFVKELESSNRSCLNATAYGHGPPAEWMVSLMAQYDRWKYEYNKELISKIRRKN